MVKWIEQSVLKEFSIFQSDFQIINFFYQQIRIYVNLSTCYLYFFTHTGVPARFPYQMTFMSFNSNTTGFARFSIITFLCNVLKIKVKVKKFSLDSVHEATYNISSAELLKPQFQRFSNKLLEMVSASVRFSSTNPQKSTVA